MIPIPFRMQPELELLVILPFRLGVETLPRSSSKRVEAYPSIADTLNHRVPELVWRAVPFDEANPAPSVVRERKGVFLLGTVRSPAPLTTWLREAARAQGPFEVVTVSESVWYYDWGLGAAEVSVVLRPDITKNLTRLLELGNAIAEHGGQLLAFFREWERCAGALVDALRTSGHALGPAPGANETEAAGLLDGYGVTLLVRSATGPAMVLGADDVAALLNTFTGRAAQDPEPVQWPGVLAVADGYGGQVAVFDGAHQNVTSTMASVRWLWRLVSLYWPHLWATGKLLSQRTVALLADDRKAMPNLAKIRRERLALQALLQEASPRSICGNPLDRRVYGGVWTAWYGDELVAEVKEHQEFLRHYFDEAVSLATTRYQQRVNWILFVLNILTFTSVIATVITAYDVRNDVLVPSVRLLLIGLGSGLFGLLSMLFVLAGRYLRS